MRVKDIPVMLHAYPIYLHKSLEMWSRNKGIDIIGSHRIVEKALTIMGMLSMIENVSGKRMKVLRRRYHALMRYA